MTRALITTSMLLNVLVLVPVTTALLRNAQWVTSAYGPPAPARSILLAVYLAILIASVVLLIRPNTAAVAALLAVQVTYKLLTVWSVGTLTNPVVASNLAIAVIHLVTLVTILRS